MSIVAIFLAVVAFVILLVFGICFFSDGWEEEMKQLLFIVIVLLVGAFLCYQLPRFFAHERYHQLVVTQAGACLHFTYQKCENIPLDIDECSDVDERIECVDLQKFLTDYHPDKIVFGDTN